MSASVIPQHTIKKWRLVVFAVFALVAALFFAVIFDGMSSLLEPWVLLEATSKTYHPEIHRWHEAIWGALTTLLFAGTLLSLLWGGQKRPLLAQFFVVGMALFTLSPLPFPGGFDAMQVIIEVVIVLLFITAYPDKRALFSISSNGRVSILLFVLSVLALIAVSPDVLRNVGWQLADHVSEHGVGLHWLTSAFVDLLLIIGAFLTSTKQPGWKALGVIIGIAFLYLGIAAITVPTHPGSWGTIGGVLSVLGGIAFIAATLYEARRVPLLSTTVAHTAEQPARATVTEKLR